MNILKCSGIIIPIGFIIFSLLNCNSNSKSSKDALAVIHERKSVRSFTGGAVMKEDLEKILRAGMAAPTAVNMQPWAFIVNRPLPAAGNPGGCST